MLIVPAIDLRGGQCVRLRQGDFDRETVFGNDPAAMVDRWVEEGAEYLHVVDLDGAKEGRIVNGDAIRRILARAKIRCQVGGGLRTEGDIASALNWGADRVVVGSKACTDPGWLEEMCNRFPHRLVLGIDAKENKVAVEGWTQLSDQPVLEMAQQYAALPLAAVVCTDIARDGMLQGPNFAAIAEMITAVRIPVIASGGITTLEDIRRLAHLRVAGCIIGRALYEGKLVLREAINVAKEGS